MPIYFNLAPTPEVSRSQEHVEQMAWEEWHPHPGANGIPAPNPFLRRTRPSPGRSFHLLGLPDAFGGGGLTPAHPEGPPILSVQTHLNDVWLGEGPDSEGRC